MAQNYEVFVGDRPLLICRQIVDNSAFEGFLTFRLNGPAEWQLILESLASSVDSSGALVLCDDPGSTWRSFKKEFVLIKAAGGFVLDSEERVLAILRLGKWDLPKGKREKGENKKECAVREVKEECGLESLTLAAHLYTTWHTYYHKGKAILKRTDWYEMFASSTQELIPQEEEAIECVEWLDAEGLKKMRENTYASIQRVLDAGFSRPKL